MVVVDDGGGQKAKHLSPRTPHEIETAGETRAPSINTSLGLGAGILHLKQTPPLGDAGWLLGR